MSLSVKIGGHEQPGPPFEAAARRVSLERRLAEPVRWKFDLLLSKGRDEAERLARMFEDGPCTAQAFWGEPGGEPRPLGRPSRLVGARWLDRQHTTLELTGTVTVFANAQGEEPFLPRRTVHHVEGYVELGKRFAYIAELGLLENVLDQQFPAQERICVIQDGCSDWDFFAAWLRRCSVILGDSLLLTGACGDEAKSPWVITPGGTRFYREVGDVTRRSTQVGGPDEVSDFAFETWHGLVAGPSLPRNNTHVTCQTLPAREFSRGAWDEWRQLDLPLFKRGGGAMVVGVRDHLIDGGAAQPTWVTSLFALPAGSSYAQAPPAGEVERPWVGVGEVQESDPTSPWLKVRLKGFAGRHGEDDLVWARASTPYSGADGTKGLHLVPERYTPLGLVWSGDWEEPVLALGNLRYKDAALPAPSLTLESKAEVKTEEVSINSEKVGLKSQGEVTFDADGIKVALSGGKFRTGS